MPAYVTHQIPLDADGKVLKEVEYLLWTLAKTDDGQPVLLRAMFRNDGIWQEGVQITVVGEWDAAPAPEATEEKKK